MYIYATSIYVHTMLYWNIHYVLLQYGIGVYIYMYIHIYIYILQYVWRVHIYILYNIL